jgi:hypothetical protein
MVSMLLGCTEKIEGPNRIHKYDLRNAMVLLCKREWLKSKRKKVIHNSVVTFVCDSALTQLHSAPKKHA